LSVPFISTRAIGKLPDYLALALSQAEISKVFEAADLPEMLAATPDRYIPQKTFLCLLDAAARAVGDPEFGLDLAERFTLADYGEWGRYLRGAATLKKALPRCARSLKFHATHDRSWIVPSGDEVMFKNYKVVGRVVGYRHFAVRTAFVMTSIIRAYTGANWHPLRVEFDFPRPRSSTRYEDLFRCPVIFGRPSIAVAFERNALTNNRLLFTGHKTVTYSDLCRAAGPPAPTNLISKVKEAIRLRLMDAEVNIDGVARHLEIGPRTLQRRLNDENTAFRALVSQVRARRALELLRETETPIVDIAVELGYSSSACFSRAFSRAVGLPPSKIRSCVAEM
jgi:AraC-like DNA-binding protein